MLEHIKEVDPEIYNAIVGEIIRQQENLELIASENFAPMAVLEAQGSVLTNKYAEGYPQKRYYGGCEFVDIAESLAIERAKLLFGAEHANLQPHSGTQANIAVYLSSMNPGDTLMGLSLTCGGHLSHGHPLNFSGKYFNVVAYGVDKETELINYDEVEELALKHKPKIISVGASAYSRVIDWKRFKDIADKSAAYLMADIAHYAGLVAAGIYPSPVPYADFVTTTTHKTLRGPRAGLILCKQQFQQAIDKTVFPGTQGGPLMHVIAAKAVALKIAMTEEFKQYQIQILKNSRTLCKELQTKNFRIVSGGTDSHMFLVDLRNKNFTGKQAEEILGKAGITVNKNTIPYDPQKPFIASGIRIGTPAVTTRGMKQQEMLKIAEFIDVALKNYENETVLKNIRNEVKKMCNEFPVYPELLKEISRESRWDMIHPL